MEWPAWVHWEFIPYSANCTIRFWDMPSLVTHLQTTIFSQLVERVGKSWLAWSLSRITVRIVFLWIMVDLNDFLVLFVFPNRIQCHYLIYIPLSRNPTFKSMMWCSIHRSMISARTQKHYWLQHMNVQAMHLCECLKKVVLEYGEGENLAFSVMLHGFCANWWAEFTSLRQMTLFEHSVACHSASTIVVDHLPVWWGVTHHVSHTVMHCCLAYPW